MSTEKLTATKAEKLESLEQGQLKRQSKGKRSGALSIYDAWYNAKAFGISIFATNPRKLLARKK